MLDLGVIRPGSTIRIPFSSFDKDDGSSITMTNFAVGDILIYKDGSTTERASTNGYTATTDFDSKTGKHLAIIDLADNTTAGFFSAGSEYHVAIDSVTVDGVTVGGWIARFIIGYADAILNTTIATLSSQTSFTLTDGPAEDDALNNCQIVIHDVASKVQVGRAIIADYTGSTKTVTLAAGTTFTAAASDNVAVLGLAPLMPATAGRNLVVDSAGLGDANTVKVGPTGSGTAQTAKDLGAINVTNLNTLSGHDPGATLGTSTLTQTQVTGGAYALNSSSFAFNSALDLTTTMKASVNTEVDSALDTAIPGSPTANSVNERIQTMDNAYTATRAGYLDNLSAGAVAQAATALSTATWTSARAGYLDNINNANLSSVPAFPSNFASLAITAGGIVQADLQTIKTQTVTCSGGVTIPAATLASTTNITAGTITTVTNLTNAPTAGDLTSTMKASIVTAVWTTATTRRVSDATNITSTGGAVPITGNGYVSCDVKEIKAVASAGTAGYVGIDWAAVLNSDASVALSDTTMSTVDNVTSVNGIGPDVITATSIAASAGTELGTAVWASATRTLTAGTNIQLPSNGLANITAWTVAITGNITGNLSGSVGSVTGAVGSVTAAVTVTGDSATAGTRFLTMIELDGSVYRYTTNALEQAPSGSATVAGYASGQDPATLVLGAVAASWNSAGTIGAKINAAGSAANPMLDNPDDYDPNTLGGYIARIGAGQVTFSGPVITSASSFSVYQGDDYLIADARALPWTFDATYDLTGATVRLKINSSSVTPITGTKSGEGTSSQLVRFEISRTVTAALRVSVYGFEIEATLASGSVVTLVPNGMMTVLQQI